MKTTAQTLRDISLKAYQETSLKRISSFIEDAIKKSTFAAQRGDVRCEMSCKHLSKSEIEQCKEILINSHGFGVKVVIAKRSNYCKQIVDDSDLVIIEW